MLSPVVREFAAQRARANGRDMRPQANLRRQFVDAFLANHRGIHIGREQLLGPVLGGLHDNTDRGPVESLPRAIRRLFQTVLQDGRTGNVSGDPGSSQNGGLARGARRRVSSGF